MLSQRCYLTEVGGGSLTKNLSRKTVDTGFSPALLSAILFKAISSNLLNRISTNHQTKSSSGLHWYSALLPVRDIVLRGHYS